MAQRAWEEEPTVGAAGHGTTALGNGWPMSGTMGLLLQHHGWPPRVSKIQHRGEERP